jgi:hypothetical protein
VDAQAVAGRQDVVQADISMANAPAETLRGVLGDVDASGRGKLADEHTVVARENREDDCERIVEPAA